MKKHIKTIVPIVMSVVIGALSMVICLREILYPVDKIFSDPLYYMQTTTDPQIKIIGIDEKTLDALGPMDTWTRDVYADLVGKLTENEGYAPDVIAFDILFIGEVAAESDERFANAVENAGNVVVAANVLWRDKGTIDFEGNFYLLKKSK